VETLTLWQSLIIAIWVAAVMSRSLLGGATLTLRFSPLMTGLIVGIVMGDVAGAMKVTAAIQLIYMGVFAPGGSMPSEPAVAASIAVPVALLGNLSPESAIAVAVPVGLLGSYSYQFRFFLNTFIGKLTDKAAEALDDRAITRSVILFPILAAALVYIPIIFIALYWGAPVIADFVSTLEGTAVTHILDVIGGGLAAIGIATTIYVIGRREYLVFFLLAFFMSVMFKDLGVTMVTYAIIGTVIATMFVLAKSDKGGPTASTTGSDSTVVDEDDF